MSREDQYNVTVTVSYGGTVRDLGTFDTFDGGAIDSEETKYYPGGMGTQLSLGGRKSVSNVTVGRLYQLDRDHPDMGWLSGGVGLAEVTVTKTSLGVDRATVSHPLVYTGKLKTLTPPNHDSQSSSPAVWTMEISSASVVQQ